MDVDVDKPPFAVGQVVTVFRSRLRDDIGRTGADYPEVADTILGLARAMPGFVDFKHFEAADGERVALVTFVDAESQRAWRDQADHRVAQQAGRDRYYGEYSIQVCDCTSARSFTLGN